MCTDVECDIYSLFGNYIKKNFLGNDKRGEEVFLVIDLYFINTFCIAHRITYDDFIHSIQRRWAWNITSSSGIIESLGFIGIQLYAASQMENEGGYSSNNFRDRICSIEMLDLHLKEWDEWAEKYQDTLWNKYYRWCNREGFLIPHKCERRVGKDRYVQYPKTHSEEILNREDLKRIANLFVSKNLAPNEDISEVDFWKILNLSYNHKSYSRRASKILSTNRDLFKKQVYQYFLSWDGEYIEGNGVKKLDKLTNQLFLLNCEGEWFFDIKQQETSSICNFPLNTKGLMKEITQYYLFKRNNIILFKREMEYEGVWKETRFIENYEDEGLAFISSDSYRGFFSSKDIVMKVNDFMLVRITYSPGLEKYYERPRPYSLTDGVKLGHHTYLLGAPPLLTFYEPTTFWLDDEKVVSETGNFPLVFEKGSHSIKIKGYKAIEIYITEDLPYVQQWGKHSKWKLSTDGDIPIWGLMQNDGDVVGLDFGMYSHRLVLDRKVKPLTQWCRRELFNLDEKARNNHNAISKLLNL